MVRPILFDFATPQRGARGKAVKVLARTATAVSTIQAVGEGGENNLHSHSGRHGFWYVLEGSATFYTTDDEPVATVGPRQGVVIPAGFPYWFEATGDEELVLLQVHVAASAEGSIEDDRVDHEPLRASYQAAAESAREAEAG